jgi:hypothetical protein
MTNEAIDKYRYSIIRRMYHKENMAFETFKSMPSKWSLLNAWNKIFDNYYTQLTEVITWLISYLLANY